MENRLERLLTVRDAAKYLTISKSQLYAMIQKNEIPHIRVTDRRVVIRESDLKKWLDNRSSQMIN